MKAILVLVPIEEAKAPSWVTKEMIISYLDRPTWAEILDRLPTAALAIIDFARFQERKGVR